MRTQIGLQQGIALASLLGLVTANDICCPNGAQAVEVVSLQPIEAICDGHTSTYTRTETVKMHCGSGPYHGKTLAPHPPGPTTTVTQPCNGREHCQPGTTTLSPSGTKGCTVIVVPSPTPEHPRGTSTITSVCADGCAPTTIPPPPRCKTGCTATVVQPPRVTSSRGPKPPITTTTTSVCTKGPAKCKPTTISPPPSCTTGTCTVSVIETPPVTTTVTSSCSGSPEDCTPETVSPTLECTTGTCTVSVLVTPTGPLTTTAETTPPITITETETCTIDRPGCMATTIFPTPECTIGTCTVTVIETTTTDAPPPPQQTVPEDTTTALPETETIGDESVTTTIVPNSDCTGACTTTGVEPSSCVIPTQTITVSANGRDGVTSDIPVPPCATVATFRVVGGGGSGEENYGGEVKGSIPVTPGKVIQAIAGGSGVIGASGTGYGNGGATILGSRGAGAGSSLSLHGELKAVGGGGGGGWCKNRTTSNGQYYPFDGTWDTASGSAGFPGKSGEYWRTVAPTVILGKANGGKPGTQSSVGAGGISSGTYTAMTVGKSGSGRNGGASVTVGACPGNSDTKGSGNGQGGRPSLQGGGTGNTGANGSGAGQGANKDREPILPEEGGSKNVLHGSGPGKGKPNNEKCGICASGAGGGGYYGGGSGTTLLRLGTNGGSISLAAGGGGGSSYLSSGVRNASSTTNTGPISAPGMVVIVFSG